MLVPDAAPDLGARVAGRLEQLPSPSDRRDLKLLLSLFSFIPITQTRLAAWAGSRIGFKRKAFQALKRLIAITHYADTPNGAPNPQWARLSYPGPLGPPPATPKAIVPLAFARDTTLECDVVVVGSGAGGGVVAAELARAGKDVIVLEKGGYWNERDFTQREVEMLDRLYDGMGLTTTTDLGLVILQGSCLGGGTVVNYTTSFHPPDTVREEWARAGLAHFVSDEFTAHLDAVASRLHVNRDEHLPSGRDAVLIRGLERLGWHHGVLPRNTRGCSQGEDCGYCGYGCRRGAKQSTLRTYLEDAARLGARIVVNARVERVTTSRRRATGVEAVIGAPGAPACRLTVRARAIVVAAGAIHSPALLLRSGIALPALGRHLALHPATAVFAEMAEDVRPWSGTVQAHYSDQFADLDRGYGFRFETAPVHPSLAALAAPWSSREQLDGFMRRLPRLALCGILLRDREGGRVTVDSTGCPRVHYRLSSYDRAHLRRAFAAAGELLEAAGAREIWMPQAVPVSYKPSPGARERWLAAADAQGYGPNQVTLVTFHQLASCRMGVNRATSVVNPEHQVWNVPGLYVADASTVPSASGVNPMLTIMGMAHRAAGCVGNAR